MLYFYILMSNELFMTNIKTKKKLTISEQQANYIGQIYNTKYNKI